MSQSRVYSINQTVTSYEEAMKIVETAFYNNPGTKPWFIFKDTNGLTNLIAFSEDTVTDFDVLRLILQTEKQINMEVEEKHLDASMYLTDEEIVLLKKQIADNSKDLADKTHADEIFKNALNNMVENNWFAALEKSPQPLYGHRFYSNRDNQNYINEISGQDYSLGFGKK